MFSIKNRSFKRFENVTVKLSVKESKWTSLEAKTRHIFLDTLNSKHDFGPVKLSGLSKNGPPVSYFEIKFSRKVCCALTSIEAHYVSLANNFTVPFSKLLELPSLMENKTA